MVELGLTTAAADQGIEEMMDSADGKLMASRKALDAGYFVGMAHDLG